MADQSEVARLREQFFHDWCDQHLDWRVTEACHNQLDALLAAVRQHAVAEVQALLDSEREALAGERQAYNDFVRWLHGDQTYPVVGHARYQALKVLTDLAAAREALKDMPALCCYGCEQGAPIIPDHPANRPRHRIRDEHDGGTYTSDCHAVKVKQRLRLLAGDPVSGGTNA